MDGILLNNKHTFKDFGLIYETRSISPAQKKQSFQESAFVDGDIDTSPKNIFNECLYKSRTITYTFDKIVSKQSEAEKVVSLVQNWITPGEIRDDRDTEFVYISTYAKISSATYSKKKLKLQLEFTVNPYKVSRTTTDICNIVILSGSGYQQANITNRFSTNNIIITASADTTVKDSLTTPLQQYVAEKDKEEDRLIVKSGTTPIYFKKQSANYNVKIQIRERRL